MAHSLQIKAKALAMLMTGNSPRYVAEHTGVPLTTVKRWRNKDVRQQRHLWVKMIGGSDKP